MRVRNVVLAAASFFALSSFAQSANPQAKVQVIEIATLNMANGITPQEFQKADKEMQATYMVRRPAFCPGSGSGKHGTWIAILHWRSLAHADASMKSYSSAAGTAKWMGEIAPNSLVMNR